MTVQFYDQNDVGYFEHELGFNFAQSLGMVSFLSSFNFGGAEKALEIIGTIDSAFNFGWDGNIDQESDNVIQTAKHYITEHYTEDIGRSQVAAAVYLTPEYLAKIFKRSEGINLKDYIYQLKIQEARRLLMAGARVSEVAQLVGFDNFAYFSTIFKKVTGMSPNEYKKAGERTKDESTGIN
jgi:YesN/AraC family two-component response regulator